MFSLIRVLVKGVLFEVLLQVALKSKLIRHCARQLQGAEYVGNDEEERPKASLRTAKCYLKTRCINLLAGEQADPTWCKSTGGQLHMWTVTMGEDLKPLAEPRVVPFEH